MNNPASETKKFHESNFNQAGPLASKKHNNQTFMFNNINNIQKTMIGKENKSFSPDHTKIPKTKTKTRKSCSSDNFSNDVVKANWKHQKLDPVSSEISGVNERILGNQEENNLLKTDKINALKISPPQENEKWMEEDNDEEAALNNDSEEEEETMQEKK
eukprot:CAMPEP_0170539404 /NCGR_PEP_ID=MMETSP0209-20121228/103905_1 /TAXON_ID=665100 ORGANISM="Litonotus pictus, Strain P1" /NCGR_SAMPLE_ID=MMETSP0209 /ASSEMBLY_ACC=CAM_ASM_000301 /LENGTH=158 /DNA_ID=CAMNT_0010841325 /DNA_START=71 /DNA_END=548 /DNA_ORIENTATION=-